MVFCIQVTEDGKCSTVENNLLPDENLSLDQFIRETENVSECDVLQVLLFWCMSMHDSSNGRAVALYLADQGSNPPSGSV